ncbi:MAG: hypothetical protein AAF548_18750 [Actinomycetota bacterium]
MGETTVGELADALIEQVRGHLERFVAHHTHEWRVPGMFAGHAIGPEVAADLVYTLGFLHEAGVTEVAGTPIEEAISAVLRRIDGPGCNTFYSYRVAETLRRFGDFDGNPILRDWPDDRVANIAAAIDSTGYVEYFDAGFFPKNFAAVLARCEHARRALGVDIDVDVRDRLVGQLIEVMDASDTGYLDDSQSGIGRYDIYNADVYLFTLPLEELLGDRWRRGVTAALDLVDAVAATDGSAITWGRSTGALSCCLTIELAALGISRGLVAEPDRWLARAANAATRFEDWIDDGLITTHKHRSTYHYRGPQRRLQMTLDCLGKLADSALMLREASDQTVEASTLEEAFPDRDELVVLDAERNAAVWTYRSQDVAFVVPFVGGTISDYLPAPRNPGVFEVPVDAPLATGTPLLWAGFGYSVAGGLPTSLTKTAGGVVATYEGFPVGNEMELGEQSTPAPGGRTVRFRVDGPTIAIEEELHFPKPPQMLSIQMTETARRRLDVRFDCDQPHAVTTIDVEGLAEYRSFWGELPRVHQIDVDAEAETNVRWSMRPRRRLGVSQRHDGYMATIYDPMEPTIDIEEFPVGTIARGDEALGPISGLDLFHNHWPEWLTQQDPDVHRRFVSRLRDAGVRIVWTQHNLEPHMKVDLHDVYQVWADGADAVIHHSEWGRAAVEARYHFRPDAIHRVIPHPHWGPRYDGSLDRDEAAERLGLAPAAIRLGIVGAPRAEKDVQTVIDAVHRCDRDDISLYVGSLRDEQVPDDLRIVAPAYRHLPLSAYNDQVVACDALVLPYASDGMLTTGVVGDAIAAGRAAITSPWPYLAEALGDAAITYDGSVDGLVDVLESLTADDLDRSASAAVDHRPETAPESVAAAHLDLYDALGVHITRR